MTRTLAWFLGGAAALALMAVAVPSGASGPTLDKAPPPAAIDGKTVFLETCKKCHGEDGKGETGIGKKAKDAGKNWPDLTTSKVGPDKAKEIIENGVEGSLMKAYKEKLPPEAIVAVRDYVLTLRASAGN